MAYKYESDAQFAEAIYTNLASYQDILIRQRDQGRAPDQCVVPTISICYDQLRSLTGRTKIKQAFVESLVGHLESWGLDVEQEHNSLTITKPQDILPTDFEDFTVFDDIVSTVLRTRGPIRLCEEDIFA